MMGTSAVFIVYEWNHAKSLEHNSQFDWALTNNNKDLNYLTI